MKFFSSNNQRPLEIFIHIIVWMLIFFFPILLSGDKSLSDINWLEYFRHVKMPFMFLIVFYTNYCFLVPHFLLKKQSKKYILYNFILVVGISLLTHLGDKPLNKRPPLLKENIEEKISRQFDNKEPDRNTQKQYFPSSRRKHFNRPPRWTFIMRDTILLLCTVGLGAAIRMSGEWSKAETALQEAERNRTEAELNNLRNQLNPHFLLNTLNNIYALIAFDTDKAQQAVQDLSKLLRYVLYENQQTYVPLAREIDFINNYIELMRIRLAKEVEVSIHIHVPANSTVQIAPLIFISLIENAFKHGISPTKPSFISISIAQIEQKEVRCEIINSNHPKNNSDKSGSGIGLEQVRKRLELLYPERYEWKNEISENGEVYSSILTIQV